jgi:hypothetical protein
VPFRTRPQQVQLMVERALEAKVPFAWFLADEEFGQNPGLRAFLEDRSLAYAMGFADRHGLDQRLLRDVLDAGPMASGCRRTPRSPTRAGGRPASTNWSRASRGMPSPAGPAASARRGSAPTTGPWSTPPIRITASWPGAFWTGPSSPTSTASAPPRPAGRTGARGGVEGAGGGVLRGREAGGGARSVSGSRVRGVVPAHHDVDACAKSAGGDVPDASKGSLTLWAASPPKGRTIRIRMNRPLRPPHPACAEGGW